MNQYGRRAIRNACAIRNVRAAVWAGVGGIVAVGLTGCLKLDAELAIEGDSVSGTAVVAASKEFLSEADAEPDQVIGDLPGLDFLGAAAGESYEDDDYIGQQYEFDAVDIAELADSESVTIAHDSDKGTYEVSGRIGSPDVDLDELPAALAAITQDSADLSLAITFPGDVTEHNGELSGTTVRWELGIDEVTDIRAVGLEGAPSDGDDQGADDGNGAGEDDDAAAGSADATGGLSDISTPLLVALAIIGAGAVGTIAFWVSRRGT